MLVFAKRLGESLSAHQNCCVISHLQCSLLTVWPPRDV
jgi:hypothetical protein